MIARFGAVGATATLLYLGVSLALLRAGLVPQAANLAAFAAGTAASYLGHYFFTYRSDRSHLHIGTRFVAITLGLTALSSGLHQAALLLGASPQFAAVCVAVLYPVLSFALNHFWTFRRGR